ncbi:small serum protein 2-like [Pantherophis guttatus]|uniref:Small serum protein 2-like n=1 Tax=Pantherophis guttatus TaxID=94885 RepID=A0A6P9AX69_PANGU|nr:small serum protein 2-like [Pantherophis guttatus]
MLQSKKTTMKLLLSLIVLCTIFSLCYGFCTVEIIKPKIVNGKKVEECIDSSDGSVHPVGSKWNSKNCMECYCSADQIGCCSRYGGPMSIEGCISKEDPETCTYKFYKIDNPSIPCDMAE